MSDKTPGEITVLLQRWSGGDKEALDALFPTVEAELRAIARGRLRREGGNHPMEPGDLVNEVYLRIVEQDHVDWKNRAHFFAIGAETMRRILVDHARKRNAEKRSGQHEVLRISLDLQAGRGPDFELLDLNLALDRLAGVDPMAAKTIELRCFGGATVDEVAHLLSTSRATVNRKWTFGIAWLARELSDG